MNLETIKSAYRKYFPFQGVFDGGDRIVAGRWTVQYRDFEHGSCDFRSNGEQAWFDVNGWRLFGRRKPSDGFTESRSGFQGKGEEDDPHITGSDPIAMPWVTVTRLSGKAGAWVATNPLRRKMAIALDSGGKYGKLESLRVLAVQLSNTRKKHNNAVIAWMLTWKEDRVACSRICEHVASVYPSEDFPTANSVDLQRIMEGNFLRWTHEAETSGKPMPRTRQYIMRKYGFLPPGRKLGGSSIPSVDPQGDEG